ncbi:hypothetical protein Kisp01_50050 [Kineosporia sp. NBRC 101677]|nr:hypothetical protein Kisp01_50050 [Kineosporia sp. NBRC 101677]
MADASPEMNVDEKYTAHAHPSLLRETVKKLQAKYPAVSWDSIVQKLRAQGWAELTMSDLLRVMRQRAEASQTVTAPVRKRTQKRIRKSRTFAREADVAFCAACGLPVTASGLCDCS